MSISTICRKIKKNAEEPKSYRNDWFDVSNIVKGCQTMKIQDRVSYPAVTYVFIAFNKNVKETELIQTLGSQDVTIKLSKISIFFNIHAKIIMSLKLFSFEFSKGI